MSTVELFQYESAELRTVIRDGEPWFVGRDVCAILGLSNIADSLNRLDEDGVASTDLIDSMRRKQTARIVSEAGLYELVFQSRKPEAKKFRRWVTSEVLPAIRRTGSYTATPALTGSELLAAAVLEAQSMIAAKDAQIAELEPKAVVADKFLDAEGDYAVADAAKVLSRAGIKTGQNRLFADLDHRGWVYRHKADGKWRIYQSAVDAGWMLPLPQSHYHPKTGVLVLDPPQPRVTAKGLQRILADYGQGEQLAIGGAA